MDVFKPRRGEARFIPINEENFYRETGNEQPYCMKSRDGKQRYWAICPACDNPVQIVGLYMQQADSRRPYGRHNRGRIEGLAEYDDEEYHACPFSDPKYNYSENKRKPDSPKCIALYETMRDQFDRIVYIWNKTTGITMSTDYAEKMLKLWRSNENWRNYDATYQNLPYMLVFSRQAQSLYGRKIRIDSKVYASLATCKKLKLVKKDSSSVQVLTSGKTFTEVLFGIYGHKFKVEDHHLTETFKMQVKVDGKTVHSEVVTVDPYYFDNLVSLPPERAHRNERLLSIAKEVLG